MIKNLLPFFLFLFSCATVHYSSVWRNEIGESPMTVFDEQNQIAVSCQNDSTMLYLEFYTTDTATIRKIGQRGVSLWINKGKQQQKKYAVHYPMPIDNFNKNDLTRLINTENNFKKIALEGFSGSVPEVFLCEELEDIHVDIKMSSKECFYQLNIPFALLNIDFSGVSRLSLVLESFQQMSDDNTMTDEMNSAPEMHEKLNIYKAIPIQSQSYWNLSPFYFNFLLAK